MDQTIKSQEDSLKKTFQEQEMKWMKEREKLERQRRETTRQSMLLKKHQQDYREIREANEICKTMKKNIKFKPCLIKMAVDSDGRRMTMIGQNDQAKYEEEM